MTDIFRTISKLVVQKEKSYYLVFEIKVSVLRYYIHKLYIKVIYIIKVQRLSG